MPSLNVFNALMYRGQYAGTMSSSDDIASITPTAMKEWYTQNISLNNASIYVGGDTTLDEILPLLENHFVDFPTGGQDLGELPSSKMLPEAGPSTVYFVDSPGASQSVIYAGQFVSERTADTAEELYLANMAIGGLFIARINMNLREDKGWTYGATLEFPTITFQDSLRYARRLSRTRGRFSHRKGKRT